MSKLGRISKFIGSLLGAAIVVIIREKYPQVDGVLDGVVGLALPLIGAGAGTYFAPPNKE